MKQDIINKIMFIIPWLGFGLMQSMNIPNVIHAAKTGTSMPIASVVMLTLALVCYLTDAIRKRCALHIVSSTLGILSQLTVLYFII